MMIFTTLGAIVVALSSVDAAAPIQEQLRNIFFRLFTGQDRDTYVDAKSRHVAELVDHLNANRTTVIYIHGFTEGINSSSVVAIVDAYLKRGDHNIIAIDWSELAGGNYIEATSHTRLVGFEISAAIERIIDAGVPEKKIHIVSHSLGSQVAGIVGMKLNGSLPRITGLDPAGPLFHIFNKRLTQSDAQFVDVIHTDAGFYGIGTATGSVDFWPNNGNRIQPGCPTQFQIYSDEAFCSHHRSYYYYAESVLNETAFQAMRCSWDAEYTEGDNDMISMGFATPTNATGNYCLITSSEEPFGLGKDGATSTPEK